jgi:cyclic beta-1,2-glucan synthetase
MYRVAVEGLLGLTLRRGSLHVDPCIPCKWPGYEAVLNTTDAAIRVKVENPHGIARGVRLVELDGAPVDGDIPLADLAGSHHVRVVMGR